MVSMSCVLLFFFVFFFQAEDGIRDHCVTGVQTCALPILCRPGPVPGQERGSQPDRDRAGLTGAGWRPRPWRARSEERRVGKECRSRWSAEQVQKKMDEEDGKH